MARNTESERRAAQDLQRRMADHQRQTGKLPDTRANEERVQRIAERSAAERREKK